MMNIEDTDNPSDVEDMEESTLDAEPESDGEELDDDGIVNDEDEEEEIDLDDDVKLKVPKTAAQKLKELKEGALRQADYTKKTMELAESRKAFEAERQAASQMDQVEMMARGDMANTNAQIAQYEQFDWAAARAQAQAIDAENFDRAQMDALDAHWQNYELLKSRRGKIGQLLALKHQERQSKQQQSLKAHEAAVAKLLDEGTPELKKAIPDWNRSKAATLTEAMVKEYGIPREEFDGIDDPRLYMVMADATAWRQHQAKQKKAKSIEKQQEVVPAARAASGGAAPAGLSDKLSTSEWIKRREQQVRKRA